MAITNTCAAGKEMPSTKNQSKQLTDELAWGQGLRTNFERNNWLERQSAYLRDKILTPNPVYCTYLLLYSLYLFVATCRT